MAHLQVNLLADVVAFEFDDSCGNAACAHLVCALHPVPQRHTHHHSDIPHAREFAFKSVEDIGIGGYISAGKKHLWQISGAHQLGGLATHVGRILQKFQFGAVLHSHSAVGLSVVGLLYYVVGVLVGKCNV